MGPSENIENGYIGYGLEGRFRGGELRCACCLFACRVSSPRYEVEPRSILSRKKSLQGLRKVA